MSKKFLLIIVFSLTLRLLSLNQSLWLDEAISANVAKDYSYSKIISVFSPTDFHPPLYYLVLKAWTSIFGYSEFSLRLPSVIFSLLTIFLVFKFYGFWSSLLLTVNPLYLYYSQEARMYSLATLLIFSAFLAFKKNNKLLYLLFTFLSLFTFYGTVFFFTAISLYWLIKKNPKNFIVYSLAPIFSLLLLFPLLKLQYQNSQSLLQSIVNWSSVLGTANLKNIFLIPIKFTLGRFSFYPKIAYYLLAFVLAVPLWFLIFIKSFQKRLTAFIFWSTLLIGFIFSLFTPGFQYFRFLYLIPFLVIIIQKSTLYFFVFLIFSLVYLLNPAYHREDWETLSGSLSGPVYMIPSVSDPIKYYRPDIQINNLAAEISDIHITIIPYASEIHGLDYKNKLRSLGFTQNKVTDFRQLTTETWSKQFP